MGGLRLRIRASISDQAKELVYEAVQSFARYPSTAGPSGKVYVQANGIKRSISGKYIICVF